MRLSSNKIMARFAGAYVNYFRSIPLLLVITWFYLAVPFVLRWITGQDTPDRGVHLLPGGVHDVRSRVLLRNRPGRRAIDFQRPDGRSPGAGDDVRADDALDHPASGVSQNDPAAAAQSIILFQDTSLVYAVGLVDFLNATAFQRRHHRPVQ